MNSRHLKYKLLNELSNCELKVLEFIGIRGDGATVKDVRLVTQSNNSTTNTLLNNLCDLNFLVRQNEGPNGSYLYFLPPWMNLNVVKLALIERQNGNGSHKFKPESSNLDDESYASVDLKQIEANQKKILAQLNEIEALIK